MLLDVQQNIANLEKTFTDSRRVCGLQDDDRVGKDSNDGCGSGNGRTNKKGLFRYSSFNSVRDASGGGTDRKMQAILNIIIIDVYERLKIDT